MAKRRFVVCFDGTWNTPDKGAKPTNVVKMVRAVRSRDDAGASQLVFYNKGVGSGFGLDKYLGGIFGLGLTENVVDGYRFVANNYEPGDEIYIFGFSRGAYTARSLAGLIGLAGILTPANLGSDLAKAIDIYREKDLDRAEKLRRIDALGFEERRPARIRCVGVWDTVGSLGIPGDRGRTFLGGKYYFHDVELGGHIEVALHAVAVDEKRSAFSPTLWVSDTGRPATAGQTVEQVWFAGAHSNVGGSYSDSTLSDITFDWMVKRVMAHTDLSLFNPDANAPNLRNAAARSIDSRSALYFVSSHFPYQRLINGCVPDGGGFGEWFRRTFPSHDRRNIPPDGLKTVNESLHVSVLERWNQKEVLHDCKDDKDTRKSSYRPETLGAVIAAHRAGQSIPVIGWDGELLDPAAVPWPDAAGPTG
jgi:uncharacterized protein (DUF2235 family)